MAEGVQVGGSAGRDEESDGEGGTRRDFLYLATAAVAAYGVASVIWPLIDQMNPAADVLALASVDVDLSPIELGQRVTVTWRGKPVFIDHRTKERIDEARSVDVNDLRDPQTDEERVKKAEWLVMVGICTHLGCIPLGQKPTDDRGPYDGWFCPCHGSVYDTSGRIRQGPAPRNLVVPDYEFTESTAIRIG